MPEKPTLFGRSFGPDHLQVAVQKTIEEFLPDYLAEHERQRELPSEELLPFKTYEQVNEFRNWADDETPVCVIVSPGLSAAKQKGGGEYTGVFDLGVACVVHANVRENTNKLARIYGPIVRQLLLQQAGLGGVATGMDFIDEKYDDVPETEDRAQAVVQLFFTVEVPDIVNGRKGIIAPTEDPQGGSSEAPTATEATAEATQKDEVGP